VSKEQEALLASCYRSCLTLAEENGLHSVAFCCISTGEFHFPHQRAAEIAVQTVKEYLEQVKSKSEGKMEVIFNVFKDIDYEIYRDLLG
jgi:O-acetyl-ADP-ribose deacetylase (regulator of RNase III)